MANRPDHSIFIVALAAVITAMGGLTTFLVLRLLRRQRMNQSIELILERLADAEAEQDLTALASPAPVGYCMSQASRGWNRLLGAIDEITNALSLTQARTDLQQFSISNDSLRTTGLLDAIPDGIMMIDSHGEIMLASRACQGKLGRETDRLIGSSILDIFPDPQARQALQDLMTGQSGRNETTFDITPQLAAPPSPSGYNSSCTLVPNRRAFSNAGPISTPLMAGIDITAAASRASKRRSQWA